jgi:hypothetical protein
MSALPHELNHTAIANGVLLDLHADLDTIADLPAVDEVARLQHFDYPMRIEMICALAEMCARMSGSEESFQCELEWIKPDSPVGNMTRAGIVLATMTTI